MRKKPEKQRPRWVHSCPKSDEKCCEFVGWLGLHDVYAHKMGMVLRQVNQTKPEQHINFMNGNNNLRTIEWHNISKDQRDRKTTTIINRAKAIRAMIWGL